MVPINSNLQWVTNFLMPKSELVHKPIYRYQSESRSEVAIAIAETIAYNIFHAFRLKIVFGNLDGWQGCGQGWGGENEVVNG